MRYLLLLICCLISLLSYTQTEKVSDSLPVISFREYIADYTKQLNIKFEVSNEIPKYKIPFAGETVKIEPNLGLRYAFVVSYKFLSVRLGIRPKPSGTSATEKGKPKSFRLKFALLFNKWSHDFEYNQVRGYYIVDKGITDEIFPSDASNHIQFPDLTTRVFSGTSAYKLNDNYSVRATISQTERQLKSAGSFIPSIDYWYYNFDGLDTYKNLSGETIERNKYLETQGFNIAVNMGYYYTFVKKNWFANAFAIPGVGVDFNWSEAFENGSSIKDNFQELLWSFKGGIGAGYNGEKIFGGASFVKHITNESNNSDKVQFQLSKNSFFLFIGYRFKAPKQIAKPIDKIEEKIPLLESN
ncbi:DUF4421 domain-containing protein [Urechidicola sp. KH5]